MSLHHILLSTVIAALLAGCAPSSDHANIASTPVATDADASKETSKINLTRAISSEVNPDEMSDEDPNTKRYPQSQTREATSGTEQKLLVKIAEAEQAHDLSEKVKNRLLLGKIYRTHHRAHDAELTLQQAVLESEALSKGSPLKSQAAVTLGEIYQRQSKYSDSLVMYQRALNDLNGADVLTETEDRLNVRLGWIYYCMREHGKAQKMLAAVKRDDSSVAYRIALSERVALAMEAKDRVAVQNLERELNTLPPVPRYDWSFAKSFLRICARNCKKSGRDDQAAFLENEARALVIADRSGYSPGLHAAR